MPTSTTANTLNQRSLCHRMTQTCHLRHRMPPLLLLLFVHLALAKQRSLLLLLRPWSLLIRRSPVLLLLQLLLFARHRLFSSIFRMRVTPKSPKRTKMMMMTETKIPTTNASIRLPVRVISRPSPRPRVVPSPLGHPNESRGRQIPRKNAHVCIRVVAERLLQNVDWRSISHVELKTKRSEE